MLGRNIEIILTQVFPLPFKISYHCLYSCLSLRNMTECFSTTANRYLRVSDKIFSHLTKLILNLLLMNFDRIFRGLCEYLGIYFFFNHSYIELNLFKASPYFNQAVYSIIIMIMIINHYHQFNDRVRLQGRCASELLIKSLYLTGLKAGSGIHLCVACIGKLDLTVPIYPRADVIQLALVSSVQEAF